MRVSTNYSAKRTDRLILADASTGPIFIYLLDVSQIDDSRELKIKKIDSTLNAVTVIGPQNIDGLPSFPITIQNYTLNIINSDGAYWVI